MNAEDRAFAADMRAAREAAGMSQEQVAAAMAERGFPFSQATIWKVEAQRRPVRVGEAVELARLLGKTWTAQDAARADGRRGAPPKKSRRTPLLPAAPTAAPVSDAAGRSAPSHLGVTLGFAPSSARAHRGAPGMVRL